MITASKTLKGLAFVGACGLHGMLALTYTPNMQVEIAGASGASVAMLGSSFADMAIGTLSPEGTVDNADVPHASEPVQPLPVQETSAEAQIPDVPEADKPPLEDMAQAPAPQQLDALKPDAPAERHLEAQNARPAPETSVTTAVTTKTPAVSPALTTPLQSATAVLPFAPTTPLTTAVLAQPRTARQMVPKATPIIPERPMEAALAPPAIRAPEQPEKLESTTPDTTLVSRSMRPRMRTSAFEAAHQPKAKPKSKTRPKPSKKPKTAAPKKPKGNATRNARAGESTGKRGAKAKTSGSGGRTQQAGNAAVSNYPGKVMRKISRIPRPRVNARGSATIAFRISQSGGLAAVSVARSSGSSALDRAALRIVQRAAPFPRPPSGARRSFSIKIQGR